MGPVEDVMWPMSHNQKWKSVHLLVEFWLTQEGEVHPRQETA